MLNHKYKNRSDISVLIVEKSINPLNPEQAHHDIADLAFFLKGYGFTAELTWSIGNYKFDNFDEFFNSLVNKLKENEKKFMDQELIETFRRVGIDEVRDFKRLYKILKKTPINSVDDLKDYDFFILHPDFDDCDEHLKDIEEKYPDKPIIFPVVSVAAGIHEDYGRNSSAKFPIEDILKDPRYGNVYCVYTEWDFDRKIVELIEYILDEKERF